MKQEKEKTLKSHKHWEALMQKIRWSDNKAVLFIGILIGWVLASIYYR